jgi:tryptophan synthase alpha chain
MNRIADAFAAGKAAQRALFVAYVCAGDPDEETSYRICKQLIESGIDVLELGVPFSDPLADGLTNQLAAERALKSGMTESKVFRLVRRLREITEIPIVFYTYYNLVFANGLERYVRLAKEAGLDGLLTLDLPPEEADDLLKASAEVDLKTVFIVAPTTPPERLRKIADASTGFIYYVSREGVTGMRDDLAEGIGEAVSAIREVTDLPVVVGFGINNPDQVEAVGAMADGVVVGSAIVNCVPENKGDSDEIVNAVKTKVETLLQGIVSGPKAG